MTSTGSNLRGDIPDNAHHQPTRDAVVIGAGLAGLAVTIKLAQAGHAVTLVSKGIGGLQLGQGTVDLIGYAPDRVDDVAACIDAVNTWAPPHTTAIPGAPGRPAHPYSHFTGTQVIQAGEWLKELLGPDFLVGDGAHNVLLPTAVGALRPTAFYQPSMAAGVVGGPDQHMVLVGLSRLKDFYPKLCADNLSRQSGPDGGAIHARAVEVDFDVRAGEVDTNGVNHARALDLPENRQRLVNLVKPLLQPGESVGFPAVLGLNDPHAWRDIQERLGHPVFEIPIQPPSVPGMRLNQALTAIAQRYARVILGPKVTDIRAKSPSGPVSAVVTQTAGSPRVISTRNVVLAAGGFESGDIAMDSYGDVTEVALGLPVCGTDGTLLHADFWGADQPLFLAGINVNDRMQALDAINQVVRPNVYVVGGALAGSTRWREKSGEGIALASALRAAQSMVENEQ